MGLMTRLSPLNKRRFAQFKANKRGWFALWIFIALFILSLGSEIIANDKPLIFRFDGNWYFPAFVRYNEEVFGGEMPLPLETNYKGPYIQELIKEKGGWMIWAPIRFNYQSIDYDMKVPAPAPPFWSYKTEYFKNCSKAPFPALNSSTKPADVEQLAERASLPVETYKLYCIDMQGKPPPVQSWHWLGTDDQGRDVLARIIYGFRVSILFALTLTIISSIIGVVAGAIQGFYGGWIDLVGQRFMEIWSGLPMLYMLIILASFVQPNFWWLLGIMLLFSWMALVDVVRAEFLRGRNLEYVRAARALGMRNSTIMFKHILPNAMISTMTFLPFILTGAIGTLTSLDFLGFGLPAGAPSLGELVRQGKENLQAPWLGISAFSVLAIMLSLLVFIGEAARDAFDPRR